jgi:hypothetical protein
MFFGYASNYTGDCYRMWNPKTKKVSGMRDVVFLNRMFFKTPKMQVHKKQVTSDDDLDSVQQDKRGATITADFVAGNNDAATVDLWTLLCQTLQQSTTTQDSLRMEVRTGAQHTMTL